MPAAVTRPSALCLSLAYLALSLRPPAHACKSTAVRSTQPQTRSLPRVRHRSAAASALLGRSLSPTPTPQPVVVLYGSQTGTAAEMAASVGRALRRLHLRPRVRAMDAFDIRTLPKTAFLICVCSTTGQGEEPDNMRSFWRFLLQKRLPRSSLAATRFSVFGLGDSSYPKFNFVAKKLHKRLLTLGGTQLAPLGLADDQHPYGPEAALDPWLFQVTTALLEHFKLPAEPVPSAALLPPTLPLRRVDAPATSPAAGAAAPSGAPELMNGGSCLPAEAAPETVPTREQPLYAPLRQNKRITPDDHFQDVRHVIFDVSHNKALAYKPGDVAYVMVCPGQGWDGGGGTKTCFLGAGRRAPTFLGPFPHTLYPPFRPWPSQTDQTNTSQHAAGEPG